MSSLHSDLCFWEKVVIDGDRSLVGTVTALQFRPTYTDSVTLLVEVAYVHNGDAKVAWIEPKRLSRI